ncbi:hypothetical protein GWK47_024177 [Chionoecetes opilio]|uniref:Reverse transcriptase zinc-binding domain-containing protein n=1 Tax=Chionoecetes opilio TaxID=41210 RepID=A0A8J4XPZ4_CHIOP|nr:hypothetical protein GWK47_024177 [Chionoecetes opilio]
MRIGRSEASEEAGPALNAHKAAEDTSPDPNCPWCRNVSETIEHFLLQCPRFHSHRVVLRSQLLTLNLATCDLPTLLAAAGVHPSRQHAFICLTCAFLKKTACSAVILFTFGHTTLTVHLHRLRQSPDPNCPWCRNVSETIEHFLLQCPRFHSHRVVLRSQLLTLNLATCDLPTLLAAAGVHPSRQHAFICLTCAFLKKTEGRGSVTSETSAALLTNVLLPCLSFTTQESPSRRISWVALKYLLPQHATDSMALIALRSLPVRSRHSTGTERGRHTAPVAGPDARLQARGSRGGGPTLHHTAAGAPGVT